MQHPARTDAIHNEGQAAAHGTIPFALPAHTETLSHCVTTDFVAGNTMSVNCQGKLVMLHKQEQEVEREL